MQYTKITTSVLALLISLISFSQECDKLLQGGLYSFTSMTNTGSFNQDLRTYFLSEKFKSDMKSGKWGGSITVPIEGVPVTFGMDYSEDKYQEFREKILSVTQLSISSNFYQTTFSSIPNTNLYQSYVECVRIHSDVSKTGFIQGLNIETEDVVVFTIYYRPQAPGDPMPVVQSFNVQPEGSIINGRLAEGQRLNSFSMLVTAKRDLEKDLILSLVTDRGTFTSKSVAEGSLISSKEMPIGTIIASFLNLEQFNVATKNNEKSPGGVWTSLKSKWSPCDGRPIPNSKFSKIANQTNVPDLRGVFLRGLNSFDPYYTVQPQDNSQLNPETTSVGQYQRDELKKHNHNVPGNGNGQTGWALENVGRTGTYPTSEYPGATETRPKNVSLFYYIKVN
ncbi:MAG: hypothetical protein HYZ15_01935 [Sphingobacteriales bacterium]|nr:hypothetical protein [Sphingobacteriales bacterium]